MKRLKDTFGAGDLFNPGKIFPSAEVGAGAGQEQIMRSMGPDASI
jgi:hypothetical protein